VSDYTTRLAIWSHQGQRRCYCGQKIYDSEQYGLQHVADWYDDKLAREQKIRAHQPQLS